MNAHSPAQVLETIVWAVLPVDPTAARRGGQARCTGDEHRWLPAELSLRSARTGYARLFCRDCSASRPCAEPPAYAAPWYGQVGVPVPS